MSNSKTYITDGEHPQSQIGASLEALCATIEARRAAGGSRGESAAGGPRGESATGGPRGESLHGESGESAAGDAAKEYADTSSYTYKLLSGELEKLTAKVTEEAGEVADSAKQVEVGKDSIDHLRYEAGDVLYHLMVLLARFNISLDELAAEMNNRMQENERPQGCVLLHPEYVQRGK